MTIRPSNMAIIVSSRYEIAWPNRLVGESWVPDIAVPSPNNVVKSKSGGAMKTAPPQGQL
jgi:hypothetical protein